MLLQETEDRARATADVREQLREVRLQIYNDDGPQDTQFLDVMAQP